MAPHDDLELQSFGPPQRKFSLISRIATGTFLQKTSLEDAQNEIPIPLVPYEDVRVSKQLITLIVDNQPMTPALASSCEWYQKYLKNSIRTHWALVRSALNVVDQHSSQPSREDLATALSFVHDVARQLVSKKDVALTDIVDPLVNAKHFRPELDEDENRVIPNQLVFAATGWLLLTHEARTGQGPYRLQIKKTLTASPGSVSDLNSRNFLQTSQGFGYIDKPLYELLKQFGDLIPEVKPEASRNEIISLLPASETLAVQHVCFGTVFRITQLTIEWVDSLNLHLELDVSRRTLKLFRFPSYCRMMYHEHNLHRQLMTDYTMWKLGSAKEPVVPTAAFFREILLTYRVLFGQDERSFRTFQHALPAFNQQWDCSAQDPRTLSDPLLPLLCGKSWSTPEARCLYTDIDAGAVRDFYDSNEDFPIMGQRLLALQLFVKQSHPRNLRALLMDRRDPTAWYNFWSSQTLLLFASVAIIIAALQLVFQIWQVVLAKQQLVLGNGVSSTPPLA